MMNSGPFSASIRCNDEILILSKPLLSSEEVAICDPARDTYRTLKQEKTVGRTQK